MKDIKTGASWSGGKDSCFAVMQALKEEAELMVILNVLNEQGKISRSHGIPVPLLHAQANAMGVPIITIPSSWQEYEQRFTGALKILKQQYGVETMIFGDIDLQEHRDWEEKVCRNAGLGALLPIWKKDRKELVHQMLDSGIEAMIVSCNTVMGETFLGRTLTKELIPELEAIGVDVCGENGEFHTLVVNCPLFSNRIAVPSYKKTLHENYWFVVWDTDQSKSAS
jgi:diphthine-ammonia ligase